MEKRDVFSEMVERWPSALVARTKVGEFSCGVLTGKYMANLESLGLSPERVKIGGRVAYPTRPLAQWMRDRAHK